MTGYAEIIPGNPTARLLPGSRRYAHDRFFCFPQPHLKDTKELVRLAAGLGFAEQARMKGLNLRRRISLSWRFFIGTLRIIGHW
jgi:hypothetical protein